MQDDKLKEAVEHGTVYLPIKSYSFYENQNFFQVSHHWHEEIEILYFERGAFLLERNMLPEEIQEGDIVFINRSEVHQLRGKDVPSIHHAIVFDLQMLKFERYDQAQSAVIAPLWNGAASFPEKIAETDALYPAFLSDYLTILKAARECKGGWYLRVKAALLSMLAILEENGYFRENANSRLMENDYQVQEIKKILKYIGAHYQDKIFLAELAGEAGMNEQYFCRFFRRMTGKTPMEYINAYRIEHAAELLLEGNGKIMQICYESGFENVSYFIRRFKQYKGMTPREYRAMRLAGEKQTDADK